jgi:hypothetical protein
LFLDLRLLKVLDWEHSPGFASKGLAWIKCASIKLRDWFSLHFGKKVLLALVDIKIWFGYIKT